MLNYHKMGHDAFMAERQQTPVDPFEVEGPYNLTAAAILKKVEARPALQRPEWVVSVIASTDLNPSYAFSTVILGFGSDQTCAVLWRGLYKVDIHGNKPTPEREAELYAELSAHGKQLAELPIKIDTWAIDAGGTNFDTTIRFCYNAPKVCGLMALPFTGRGTKFYKPSGKTAVKTQVPKEECHLCLAVKKGVHIQWIAWHADYWREVAQRAWLGEIGAPCGVSLYNGDHAEFAAQIILERLMGKADVGGDMVWNWHTQPGPHDYGDCMSQGYAAAAYVGIGTSGIIRRRTKKRGRKVRHVSI
jgi:hypothetical protein